MTPPAPAADTAADNASHGAETFDLFDLRPGFYDDPYPWFERLRRARPVCPQADGSFVLTRYDHIAAVYRDPATWSSDKTVEFKPKMGDTSLYEHHTTSLVFRDPPDHTRIRKLFQAAFTRKALAALRPRIEALVDGYLDEMADLTAGGDGSGGPAEVDMVAAFAFKLPVEVICDMLGAPVSDRHRIRDWARLILGGLEPVLPAEKLAACAAAVDEFKAYLRALVAHRAANPTDGRTGEVLSALIAAEEDGEKLTELELLHQCIFLLNAGHETSTNMLSHGVHELLRHPAELARLIADPTLADTAVEEILRFQAPVQINNRRATRDAEIGGTALAAGTTVHQMIGAANRDPDQFPEPDRFDISRRPNRHLAFGLGIHTCAGNSLARMEGAIAFTRLFARFPKMHLATPAKIAPRARFREVTELRVAVG